LIASPRAAPYHAVSDLPALPCRLREGDPTVLLPVLHYALLDYSPHVAKELLDKVRHE
jgi:hypothetical protein